MINFAASIFYNVIDLHKLMLAFRVVKIILQATQFTRDQRRVLQIFISGSKYLSYIHVEKYRFHIDRKHFETKYKTVVLSWWQFSMVIICTWNINNLSCTPVNMKRYDELRQFNYETISFL